MAGRAFYVKVQLDVQAVTCPGVWLCPNGKVALQIHAFESCAETCRISPIFPLLFHEKFTFSKIFTRIISLTDLQRTLEQEFLNAKLIQWITPAGRGITLATFETNLADLLYPAPCFKGLLSGVDIDLLMEPTKCFPGIIAPKIEVSTKTVVEEMLEPYDTGKRYIINPKMINSKQTATCGQRKRPAKGIIRQRRVCHTKSKPRSQSCRPYRQRSNSMGDSERCLYHQADSQISQCYHSVRKGVPRTGLQKSIAYDDTHVTDNCPVCWKYNCYFSKCHDDSSVARRYVESRQRYGNSTRHHRNLPDGSACCCVCRPERASDAEEELAVSLSHRQRGREKLCSEETLANNIPECDPCCEFSRDYSSQSFYKNLEKFYKRMYRQAKIRAQEVEG